MKGYKSRTYQNKIGHPQTKEFLWDGCWITKLVGTLTSEQMQRDIVLEWKNEESYRKKYFSHSGRWQMMGCVGLNVWWISLFVFASYFKWSKKIELGFNRWLAYILLYSVVLSAICMGITGKVIKPVAVREISFIDIIRQTRQDPLHGQVYALKEAFPAEQYESIVKMRDDVQDFLRFASLDNPFLTGPLVLEDSPGNFTIEDVDGKIAYFLYSRNAAKYQLSEIEEVSVDELFKKKYEDLDQSEHLHSLIEVISIPRPLSEISFLQVKVLVKLYKQRPLEQIPQILEYLTLLKQQNSNDKDAREVIKQKTANVLRMLACITHIEPPTDLQDQKAVDEFLKQIMDSTQTVS
ncbi:MAG: hypothetical protein GXY41_05545 [Phycisphaerae bacterium]|nr:hypothetical protein [Phycisphaerae bacterium]